jgi:hypothetical protein
MARDRPPDQCREQSQNCMTDPDEIHRCGGRAGERNLIKAPGGQVNHVPNRSLGKMHLFGSDADFEAFEEVMIKARQRHPIRILADCILSNHWHFVVWPEADGQVTDFFRGLARTHAMRWRAAHQTAFPAGSFIECAPRDV